MQVTNYSVAQNSVSTSKQVCKYDYDGDGSVSILEQQEELKKCLQENVTIKEACELGFKISDVIETSGKFFTVLDSSLSDINERVLNRIRGFVEFAVTHATSLLNGGRTAYTDDSKTVVYKLNADYGTTSSPSLRYKDGEYTVEAQIENGEIESYNLYDKQYRSIEQHRDYDGDGIAEHKIYRQFDKNGNEIQQDQDIDGDGTIDRRYIMEYDSNGREIKESVDLDMDGKIDKVKEYK